MVFIVLALSPAMAQADPPAGAFRFIYDADGRLRGAIDPESDTAAYSWDPAGNLLSIDRYSSDVLSILEANPSRGAVGETIEIEGTGFSETPASNTVKFNGTSATVKAATPWQLTVEVPVGATSGPVTVQTPGEGPIASPKSFTVESSSLPLISSLSPSLAVSGQEVTISGSNFETSPIDNVVALDRSRPELLSASSTTIKFKVPPERLGGRVSVSTPRGSSAGVDLFVPPSGTATSKVGTTGRLAPGVPKSVAFSGSEKVALMLFDGVAGQRASLALSESTITSGSVSIWSPGGSQLASGSFTKSGGGLIETGTLPATGTYTVLLTPVGTSSGSLKATAHVFQEPTGAITPVASAQGESRSVSITAPGQNARFKVSLTPTTRVALRTNNSNMSGSYKVKWVSPDGTTTISTIFNAKENWFWNTRTFSPGGDWTLMVDPEGIATGTVDLQVWEAPDKTGAAIPEGGGSVTSTIDVPGQRELITFAGVKDELITWLTSEGTIAAGVEVTLLRPNGAVLPGGFPEQTVLPETGTYTFVVDPYSTGLQPVANGIGSVKLTAKPVPPDQTGTITPAATSSGTTQSVSITKADQNARFKVPLSAGAKVALRTNNSNMGGPYKVKWISPDGLTSVTTTFNAKENWFWDTRTFSAAGEWTLMVDPEGTATGTVDLQLWEAPDKTGSTVTPSTKGGSVTSTITIPGQRELITFSGTASQLITVKAEESTITSGKMLVLKPDGTTLTGSEATFSTSSFGRREVTLPTTGTYTIVMDPPSTGIQPVTNGTGSAKVTAYLGSHVAWFTPIEPTLQLVRSEAEPLERPDGYSDITSAGKVQRQVQGTPPRGGREDRQASRADGITPKMRAFDPPALKIWHPPRNMPGWEAAEPKTPWAEIDALQAPEGTTALAGQILERNGLPLSGVEVSVDDTTTRTDEAGRFLLSGLSAGEQTLTVDGESLSGKRHYGSYEVNVELANDETTVLDYTVWLTPLDPAGDRRIASPTKQDTSLTTPSIPGLEVRIPEGTVIADEEGKRVRDLNLTAIPVNQAPFPLPPFVPIPVYFTAQPGGAYLSKGAQVVYPNWGDLRPGQRAEFWNYDPEDRGWYVYGRGTVTEDGKQVVPDPGVRIWQLTGAMLAASPLPPGTAPSGGASGGDPVDLFSGLFTYHRTDLEIPDTIPLTLERTYRPNDNNSYSFGIGTTNPYDLRLWSGAEAEEANLIMPDGQRIHYQRTTPGSAYETAEYESRSTPGPFFASTLNYNPSGSGAYWDLQLTNGMTFVFGIGRLLEIRDPYGHAMKISRSGENMTQVTSPNGRWMKFTYDSSDRISEVTDNAGRSFKYTYTSGRLTKIEAPEGRTTQYEYDSAGRMKAVINARGNKYLQNEYDAGGRVVKQTMGDGGTFEFDYEFDEAGKVKATIVTDPRGIDRKVEFNAEGLPSSETHAFGTLSAQTTSYERQPETGLVLSRTDPMGRKTSYEYDSSGNVKEVTMLDGTEDAVTTTIDYEPGTSDVTEVIDPLGHTTEFDYGAKGELLSITDALEHTTSFDYNSAGQLTSVTNPEEEETTYTYEQGDLVAVTDPLGRTTRQFVDALGRVRSITSPGGERMTFSYNASDEVTSVRGPSGAETSFAYDKDGNVVSLTNPIGGVTTMTYDAMDRVSTETNPLEETAEAKYDKEGNLVEFLSPSGAATEFSYDPLRRLDEARFGVEGLTNESTIDYGYDTGSRLVSISDSASGEYGLSYTALDQLAELSGPLGAVSYLYDAAGRRIQMSAPGQGPTSYAYDDANRLTGVSGSVGSVALAYDDADRLTSLTLPNGIEQVYGYDKAGQGTSITYKDGGETLGDLHYAYDANGLTKAIWGSLAELDLPAEMEASYNAGNQLVESGEAEYAYDADGNLLDDGANEYDWNARGELTAISGAVSASFSYDPFGRRIEKTLGGITTGLLYDGANVVQEYSGEELTGSVLTGLRMDQVFGRTTDEGTDSYLTDSLGSTIGLADESGEVTTSYSYEPFGAASRTGAASDNPFQFTGRENDGTGLQYNRARYYDPSAGRFISPDPLGFAGSGSNLYGYVGGSPLDFTDPTGKFGIPSPGDIVEGAKDVGEAVGGAVVDTGEFAWEHKSEIAAGGAFATCVFFSAGACAGMVGLSAVASTIQNVENHTACDGISGLFTWDFVRDQLITTASAGAGSLPAVLPRAVGQMYPSMLPSSRAGTWIWNGYLSLPGYLSNSWIEPGAQEYYGGGSAATSSC